MKTAFFINNSKRALGITCFKPRKDLMMKKRDEDAARVEAKKLNGEDRARYDRLNGAADRAATEGADRARQIHVANEKSEKLEELLASPSAQLAAGLAPESYPHKAIAAHSEAIELNPRNWRAHKRLS